MSPRTRILLLEPNRYRALLLQRALAHRIPKSIVVRFDEPGQALDEMHQSEYAGAIIALDSVSAAQMDELTAKLRGCPSTSVILLVSPETPRRSLAAAVDIANSVLLSDTTAPDNIANQLAFRILSEQAEPSDEPIRPITNPTQLSLIGK